MKRILIIALLATLLTLPSAPVKAAIPSLLAWQGVALDSTNAPLAAGNYTFHFAIFSDSLAGDSLWAETQIVAIEDGVMNVLLGSVAPMPDTLFDGPARYLQVQFETEAPYVPRTQIVSVGYAFRVGSINGATGGVVFGDVSIQSDLEVDGDIRITGKATVGPGHTNTGTSAFVAGESNQALAGFATVSGGTGNVATSSLSTVSGGNSNTANQEGASVGGGTDNVASGFHSAVGGGQGNVASDQYATVGGGQNDTASGAYSTVSGGTNNLASGNRATVGGGSGNSASDDHSTVSGGDQNTASGPRANVGGGAGNSAGGTQSTVGGGSSNVADSAYAAVGGGFSNMAIGRGATVSGGENNSAQAERATVSGGEQNAADTNHATISGGYSNEARGLGSTIGGGSLNVTLGTLATVAGGTQDTASGYISTVGGGWENVASGDYSTIGGGRENRASGDFAAVAGGKSNSAAGRHSFAAGLRAKANHDGSFVWADSLNSDFASTAKNQFRVRATGGVEIYTHSSLATGVTLDSGGSAWSSVSDSALKENIRPVDGGEILEKLSRLPISRWNYKAQHAGIEHVGPMAQDFYRLFGLGRDDEHISTLDPDGVALAAIQALYEKSKEIDELKSRLEELQARIEAVSLITQER